MYADFYERISKPYEHQAAKLALFDRVLVYLVAAGYVFVLGWLLYTGDARFLRVLLVCAISFALCTLIRGAINAPRPYQMYWIHPLIKRNENGKSFPSRHVFSATIIACAMFYLNPFAGVAAFLLTAIIAWVRVVGGVHFPRDVVAGTILGLACGAFGFLLIP
ncbi:phosphatase PAP2 family protein [Denitrobacterium detoxificans]|jgi:membrane-associated phospholipid phosphatase|uniref:phosphatase PAP2 family protein n=1 Tax=Denitrobacterium detoxificans TaxID=79604 RepID=UPI0026EDA16E|nr:phosphatase PAP2 family protein [Denitrobacterium detoxificans]MBE6466776.1 phosphatase PAP2 family protein [Denitrobacterium detoxificans]